MDNRELYNISHVDNTNRNSRKKFKSDPVLDQGFINYLEVPSLESITIVNIVTKLWKLQDFRKKIWNHVSKYYPISGFDVFGRNQSFDQLSKTVLEKLSLLYLPNSLKRKMRNVISTIGKEIMDWIYNYKIKIEGNRHHCNSKLVHLDYFCCTMNGTIDKAKTLELMLINEDDTNFVDCIFRTACEYCFETHIIKAWNKLPRERQALLRNSMFNGYRNHLIAYWICFMKNKLSQFINKIKHDIYNYNHTIYKNMLTLSISEGNALAAKYFWQKLTDEERNNKVEWLYLVIEEKKKDDDETNNEYADIMFFLLSQIDDKGQQKVFKEHSAIVLESLFLYSPWQRFLLPTIQTMWNFLDSNVYIDLLLRIIKEDVTYGNVFIELWCNSPTCFKRYFIQHINLQEPLHLLKNLFQYDNTESIRFILKDANVEEKKQILSSSLKSRLLLEFIYREKLASVDALIRGCSVSECEIKDVKENILMEEGIGLCYKWLCDDNFQGVQKFVEWGFSQDQVNTLKAMIANRINMRNSLDKIGCIKWWSTFESFINWCFNSNEMNKVNQFKIDNIDMIHNSPYEQMEFLISDIIVNGYLEFAKKFLVWCFPSKKEIDQFKTKLFLSDKGLDMVSHFLSYCYNDNENYNNKNNPFESVANLTEWFHPFEREVLIEFKDKLRVKYCDTLYKRDSKILIDFFDFLDSLCYGFNDKDWFKKRVSNLFIIKRNENEDYSDDGSSSNLI